MGDTGGSRLKSGLFGWTSPTSQGDFCITFPAPVSGSNWNVERNSPDYQHILDVANSAIQTYNIDRSKVFLIGYSHGGMVGYKTMCRTVLESNPYVAFAAVSTQVSWIWQGSTRECCPNHDFHALHVHGTEDGAIPYSSVTSWACLTGEDFVRRHGPVDNGCAGPSQRTSTNVASATIEEYTEGCSGKGSATMMKLQGVAHYTLSNGLWKDVWSFFESSASGSAGASAIVAPTPASLAPTPTPSAPTPPARGSLPTLGQSLVECSSGCGAGGSQCPLVVALHGMGDTGGSRLKSGLFGWTSPTSQGDFCITFPAPVSGSNWNVERNSPDYQHILDVANSAIQTYNIDRSKVFLIGYSHGGMVGYKTMCRTVLESNPYVAFAAVSTQVSWIWQGSTRECCPNHDFHALHVHGTEDGAIPYSSVTSWACLTGEDFVRRHGPVDNGCAGPSQRTSTNVASATIEEYTEGCSGKGSATMMKLQGVAHYTLSNGLWKDVWSFFESSASGSAGASAIVAPTPASLAPTPTPSAPTPPARGSLPTPGPSPAPPAGQGSWPQSGWPTGPTQPSTDGTGGHQRHRPGFRGFWR